MKSYKEYEATVTMNVMGTEVTFKMPYLEEEYDADEILDIAAQCIYDSVGLVSYSIKEME